MLYGYSVYVNQFDPTSSHSSISGWTLTRIKILDYIRVSLYLKDFFDVVLVTDEHVISGAERRSIQLNVGHCINTDTLN